MSTDSSCHNLFGKVGKSLKNLELNLGLSSNSLVSRLGVLLGLGGQRLDGLGGEVLSLESLNGVDGQLGVGLNGSETTGDEVRLGLTVSLNDLDNTRLELLDGGNVVSQNTELTSGGRDVDLGHLLLVVDGLS